MKRRILTIIMVCTMCTSIGCGNENINNTEQVQSETQDESDVQGNGGQENNVIISAESLEYRKETDAQPYFYTAWVTRGETGYYFWSSPDEIQKDMIMYYDIETEQTVPLCNKPDCKHTSKECNANFREYSDEDISFTDFFIQYYDGAVYLLGVDPERNVNLYKVAPDGSSREKYMTLYKLNVSVGSDGSESWMTPLVTIHRGYVYYYVPFESTPTIKRIKLGGGETESLFETDGERAEVMYIKAIGDYIFFGHYMYGDENSTEFKTEFCAYQISTQSTMTVFEQQIGDYCVVEDKLYYATSTGVDYYDFSNGQQGNLIDGNNGMVTLRGDSKHIYTFDWDTKMLRVYDTTGELKIEWTGEKVNNVLFGDDQYFFIEMKGMYKSILNVEELLQDKGEWEYLK